MTDLYVIVCRGAFRAQQNICGGASLKILQKDFIIDVQMGSKYVSGITFTVEKVYRMSIVIEKFLYQSHWKICHWLLASWINKIHAGLTKEV